MTLIVSHVFHHVEPNGIVGIKGRKIDDIIDALIRHEVEQLLGGRAVRIDEANPLAVLDVLDRHVFEEG